MPASLAGFLLSQMYFPSGTKILLAMEFKTFMGAMFYFAIWLESMIILLTPSGLIPGHPHHLVGRRLACSGFSKQCMDWWEGTKG